MTKDLKKEKLATWKPGGRTFQAEGNQALRSEMPDREMARDDHVSGTEGARREQKELRPQRP